MQPGKGRVKELRIEKKPLISVHISGEDSGGIRLQSRDGCTGCPGGGPDTSSFTSSPSPPWQALMEQPQHPREGIRDGGSWPH